MAMTQDAAPVPAPASAPDAAFPDVVAGDGSRTPAESLAGMAAAVARVVATATGRVAIFDAATGVQHGQLAPRERLIVGVAYLADGRILVTADEDGVRICDAITLSTLDEIRTGWTVRTMRLAAGGARLLLAGDGPVATTGRLAVVELDRP